MINVDRVTKKFGDLIALDAVSLRVEAGQSLAIIGPTAAGKTVLLKCLAGLYPIESGSMQIDGQALQVVSKRDDALNNRIGMLFQQNALFDSLTVWENISFRLLQQGLHRATAKTKAEDLLLKVGLPRSAADLSPADLSGGMQKRVGFARAIATQADILLLDNPTAGLDPILSARIEKMIQTMTRETGAAIISVTSSMTHLTEYYDAIAVMHDGKIRWSGSAEAAKTSDNPYLRQLMDGGRDGPIKARLSAA